MGKKVSKNKKSCNSSELVKEEINYKTLKIEYKDIQLIDMDCNNKTHKDKIDNFNKDNIIKVCFNGESGGGCNCLVRALLGLPFDPNLPCILSWLKNDLFLIINNKEYLIQLWNGPGQEKFRSTNKLFLKDSNIILFIYDITSSHSFRDLIDYHIYYARKEMDNSFLGCILGNKNDLYEQKTIDDNDARKYAENYGFKFSLSSAKEPNEFIEYFKILMIDYLNYYKKN